MSAREGPNCTLEKMSASEKTIPFLPKLTGLLPSSVSEGNERGLVFIPHRRNMRLSENGYFPQSLRQAQIITIEILQCIPVVIIFAFLDLRKNISFSDNPIGNSASLEI